MNAIAAKSVAAAESAGPLDTPPLTPTPKAKKEKAPKAPRVKPAACGSDAPFGYVALGYVGTANVIWSCARRDVLHLEPGNLTPPILETALGMGWILQNYLEESGNGAEGSSKINWGALRSDVIADCQAAGRYSANSVMGAGVWQLGDRIVVNAGSALWSPDGQPVPRISADGVFVESSSLGVMPDTKPATDAEALAICTALEGAPWHNPTDALLLAGWIASAPLAGVLPRRPAIYVTGPRGCGKSTVKTVVSHLLSPAAVVGEGSGTTAAGVRQLLGCDARPVILDEFGDNVADAAATAARVKTFIVQIRSAYSDDSQGSIQGTQSGRAIAYRVRYSAYISGIIPPSSMDASDRSRIVTCRLTPPAHGSVKPVLFANAPELRRLGAGLRARMVRLVPELLQTIDTVSAVLHLTASPRYADTIGTLLASWFVAVHGRAATTAEAGLLVQRCDLSKQLAQIEGASDERECADWLLGYTANGSAQSVASLIQQARKGAKQADAELASLGLAVKGDALRVCQSKSIRGLREVFEKSKFAGGGWAVVLERVDGARVDVKTWINDTTQRCVAVPLAWLFDETSLQSELPVY